MWPDMISHSAMPRVCRLLMIVGTELRIAGRRQIVEAECLDAEHHAVDGRDRCRALPRK